MESSYKNKPRAYLLAHPNCTFEEFHAATGSAKATLHVTRSKIKQQALPAVRTSRIVQEKTLFIVSNPEATLDEFKAATNGSDRDYSQARARAKKFLALRGLTNLIKPMRTKTQKPESFKRVFSEKQKPVEKPTPFAKEADEPLDDFYSEQKVSRDAAVTLGVTPDFIWYESTMIRNEMNSMISRNMTRFEHLVRVMEARQKDMTKMLEQVMDENRNLRKEKASLMTLLDAKTTPDA
jgi:hypothetical protein